MLRVADHRAAALGFVVAVAYWPGMLSPGYVPRWAAIAICLPLLTDLNPRTVPTTVRGVLLFVLALALMATVFTSPDPDGGYLELFYGVLMCLALCAGANLGRLDGLMIGMGAGLAVSSALAVTQYYAIWSPVVQGNNPSGLFFNSEVLAEFAALVLVWALISRRWDLALVGAVPIFLCGSRIAVLMVAVGMLYAFWPKAKTARIALVVSLVACAAASLIAVKGSSAEHRVTLWLATIFAWNLFGHGLGWFHAHYPVVGFSHSDAFQAVAEIGVGAFALLVIPIMVFRRKRGNDAEMATFLAGCVACIVSFPLHFPASALLLAVLAGYLVSDRGDLRVGEHIRRPDDGGRGETAGLRDFAWSGRGSEPVCLGPFYSPAARVHPAVVRIEPAAARAAGAI